VYIHASNTANSDVPRCMYRAPIALPASYAGCRRVTARARADGPCSNPSTSPAHRPGTQQQTRSSGCGGRMMGQTDRRTDAGSSHRPCSAHRASSADNWGEGQKAWAGAGRGGHFPPRRGGGGEAPPEFFSENCRSKSCITVLDSRTCVKLMGSNLDAGVQSDCSRGMLIDLQRMRQL